MKVVKLVSTGEIKYRQDPEFTVGLGIENTVKMFGGNPKDYEEVDITQEEWNTYIKKVSF
jgi:hypothetical protein